MYHCRHSAATICAVLDGKDEMRRFENILFSPLGSHDNPAAVRRVAELVAENGASITLFGVAPEPTRLQRLLHRHDFLETAATAERSRIEKLVGRLTKAIGNGASTAVEMGDPALRIIERVLSENHDLVVVTSDEDRKDTASIRRLLRECPCPVWVIRPTRARIQRVLAAVNPDPDEIELNRTILELASDMVRRHGGELHLVHAWELYGEKTMRSSAFVHVSSEELDDLLEQERHRHERAVRNLIADTELATEPWDVHLVKGPPEEVITELVARRRINLLVLGTVARTGVNRMIMGNTAERVLDNVACSVIALKPAGFVSPIKPPAP